uniref:HMG box domain-containing protein n=1 Tax=Ciona savignyi TaxID=51511 RepID=H2ZDW4_CIOSA
MLQLMMDDEATQQFIQDSLMSEPMKQQNHQPQFNSFGDDYMRYNNDINQSIPNQQAQTMPTYSCNQVYSNQRYHPYQQQKPTNQIYSNQQQPVFTQNQLSPVSTYSYAPYPTENFQTNFSQWQANANYDNCNNSSNREEFGTVSCSNFPQDQRQINPTCEYPTFQNHPVSNQSQYTGLPYTAVNSGCGQVQHVTYASPQLRTMNGDSGSSPDVDFLDGDSPETKKKGSKKRKKKGANEPQKPVSAYALFFRDTQAAIKAENPSATFGEISKIVASMWDSLSEEAKSVYKLKTETAKRDYLKQLAAYRANLVSRGGLDADDNNHPHTMLKMKIDNASSSGSHLPPPPQLQVAPNVAFRGNATGISVTSPAAISDLGTSHSTYTMSSNGVMVNPPTSEPHVVVHAVPQARETPARESGTPPPIQLRSMVPKANSPITFLPTKGQVIKVLPPNQAATIVGLEENRNRIIKMTDVIRPLTFIDTSTTVSCPHEEAQSNIQPILQTLTQEHNNALGHPVPLVMPADENLNGNANDVIDLTDAQDKETIVISESDELAEEPQVPLMPAVRVCLRSGCPNLAISDPQWDEEFCSNECVIRHCRDIFDGWASARTVSASVN